MAWAGGGIARVVGKDAAGLEQHSSQKLRCSWYSGRGCWRCSIRFQQNSDGIHNPRVANACTDSPFSASLCACDRRSWTPAGAVAMEGMDHVVRVYEMQIRKPISNMLFGHMLQTILIQVLIQNYSVIPPREFLSLTKRVVAVASDQMESVTSVPGNADQHGGEHGGGS